MNRNRLLTSLVSLALLSGCGSQAMYEAACHRLSLSVRQSAASPQFRCEKRRSKLLLQLKVDAKMGWERDASRFPEVSSEYPAHLPLTPPKPKQRSNQRNTER